jgi:DNA replication and repair protein RecF
VRVSHLTLHDYRSYERLELDLQPGVTALLGRNGQGKTNIVEAVDYLSRLSSHRVASDTPLVRHGATQAVVRAAVVRDGRTAIIEVEINPGRSNRARVNRASLGRARDVVGLVRTVLFSPEDLALVKGDPAERRRFLDDLMVLRTPRLAGVRADYERVLKQRNALLRTAAEGRSRSRSRPDEHFESTLEIWDQQLVALGSEITVTRGHLVTDLTPMLAQAYASVARGARSTEATARYVPSVGEPEAGDRVDEPVSGVAGSTATATLGSREEVAARFTEALRTRRGDEVRRGVTLVGPHRDEVALDVGALPVKGYASHGESWSFALALRLASYELLRAEGDDPILILDDVFAELDTGRRERLAEIARQAEQVLVTAAVADDVPEALHGARIDVRKVT